MQQFAIPTSADQYEYLLRLYFGSESDRLACCIDRAYRDFNRTLHGFAKISESKRLRDQGSALVRSFLTGLVDPRSACLDQPSFDKRHQTTCTELRSAYAAAGFVEFRDGQAQKWLNMALKYVFVFGETRLPGYTQVFELAHIPLDNIILEELREFGGPRLGTAWSRISYEKYMSVQLWVRDRFPGSAPLAVEFALWQGYGSGTGSGLVTRSSKAQ
jgi:hypothetical protein